MGRVIRDFLETERVVSCKSCKTHLSHPEDIISREFQGLSGRAYLFGRVINIRESHDVEKILTTGQHVIRDVSCAYCGRKIGWKYVSTTEPSQQYKVGHVILERAYVDEQPNDFFRHSSDGLRANENYLIV